MGKWVANEVLDAALSYIKTYCAQLCLCSQQPMNRYEAENTYMLAKAELTAASFGVPVDGGDTSGRKIAIPEVSYMEVSNSGTATHVAVVGLNSLFYVTTCPDQAVTSGGGTAVCPSFDIEIGDPE